MDATGDALEEDVRENEQEGGATHGFVEELGVGTGGMGEC